jgi:hypothetical protein
LLDKERIIRDLRAELEASKGLGSKRSLMSESKSHTKDAQAANLQDYIQHLETTVACLETDLCQSQAQLKLKDSEFTGLVTQINLLDATQLDYFKNRLKAKEGFQPIPPRCDAEPPKPSFPAEDIAGRRSFFDDEAIDI